MQSRVVSLRDYREVSLDIPTFEPDLAALQRELDRLRNPYVSWQDGGAAARGDMVSCSLRSDVPRYQKDKVHFVAGSGVYNHALEELSVGMRAGETRTSSLPEGQVSLTVQAVKKRVTPPLSDEMVAALGLPGVLTVAQYRRHLLGLQLDQSAEQASYALTAQVKRTVLDESAFVLAKADWKLAVGQELDRCRAIARQDGMVLEEMTAEQFAGNIPVRSYAELVAMTQDSCWDSLRCYLAGRHYAERDGFVVTKRGHEAFLHDYASTWHVSEAQARDAQPWDTYEFNQYAAHAETLWRDHAVRLYREKNQLPDEEGDLR